MTTVSNPGDRLRSFLVMLATAATIAFNVLAAMGYVNGVTPAEISAMYPTILTPAGYAFSIWSIIYLGLASFSIYQALPGNLGRFGGMRTLYIVSCVLNCGWIYFWHHDQPGICLFLIAALAAVLIVIVAKFRTSVSVTETWLVKGTFGLYAGWVTVASIVNLFVYLRSANVPAAMSETFGSVAVLAATAAAVVVTWRFANNFFPLAVAWALTAIAIKQSGSTAIVVACAIGVVVALIMSLTFIMRLPTFTASEKNE